MAQKRSREMSDFWLTCPKALIKVILEYHDLRDLCLVDEKGFCGRLGAVASLDAYQITKYQFPLKTHHSLLPNFRRIQERVSESGILWPIA